MSKIFSVETIFNFDSIPLLLEPDLFDARKEVKYRRTKIFVYYLISALAFSLLAYTALYFILGYSYGINFFKYYGFLAFFFVSGLFWGTFLGLAKLLDFQKKLRNDA